MTFTKPGAMPASRLRLSSNTLEHTKARACVHTRKQSGRERETDVGYPSHNGVKLQVEGANEYKPIDLLGNQLQPSASSISRSKSYAVFATRFQRCCM